MKAQTVVRVGTGSIIFFVLEYHYCECCTKIGAFTTRERADKFIESCARKRNRKKKREAREYEYDADDEVFKKTWKDYVNDFTVEEYTLDKGVIDELWL